jgi:hypothetical protein
VAATRFAYASGSETSRFVAIKALLDTNSYSSFLIVFSEIVIYYCLPNLSTKPSRARFTVKYSARALSHQRGEATMKAAQPRIRLFLEQLEDRVLLSSTASIDMTYATTTDARTVSVNYTINGGSLAGQNVSFNIYRSAAFDSLGGAQLIGTATIPGSDSADLSAGSHTGVKLSLTAPSGQPVTGLTPNTALPFIVVVANLDGSSASFETHVLGVIAHGLEYDGQVPDWENLLAFDLRMHGYEAVIPFNWAVLSIVPFPFAIQLASNMLYNQVVAEADQLAGQHPGDVVDINFIGHSRGTVVISEVLQSLVGTTDPALQGGFMEMTLLDPHPANNAFGQFSFLPIAQDFAAVVNLFQSLTLDPQVIVPSNVDQVFDFDEQSAAGQLGWLIGYLLTSSSSQLRQFGLNLWGEPAGNLPNQSAQPIEETNLTNVFTPLLGLIGHSEVPLWYILNVANANQTFTYSG